MSESEYLAQAHLIERQTIEISPIKTSGLILDIGGGGEGIIGKLNGEQVVAIDKRQSELEETENKALKIVMDATDLKFLTETFTVATAFFTMMYIPNDLKQRVFEETYRVLKKGGCFYIWDANIPEKIDDKKYFVGSFEETRNAVSQTASTWNRIQNYKRRNSRTHILPQV